MTQGFEVIPQSSDVRIRVWGHTLGELFLNALKGAAFYMKPEVLAFVRKAKRVKQEIKVEAMDINTLLIEFLSHALALSDTHDAVFLGAAFTKFGEDFLEGTLTGIAVPGEREIKAVSYDEVDIKKNPDSGLYETVLVFEV